MNNDSQTDWDNLFDQLPIDLATRPKERQATRQRALEVYDRQLSAQSRSQTTYTIGRFLMRYKVPHSLAAILIIAFGFWLSQSLNTQALAFDVLIENFMKVKSARYDTRVLTEGQPPIQLKGYYLEPMHIREEYQHVTNIYDWTIGKQISLDINTKRATIFSLKNLPDQLKNGGQTGNWFEGIRLMLKASSNNPDTKVISLGEKQFDGRLLVGIRLEMVGIPLTIWADPKTQLPVRIESIMPGPPKTEVVMMNFEFDVDLDETLFSVQVPSGFKVSDVDIDLSPPTESEFITALRMCCEVSNGEFPSGFDPYSIGKYAATYIGAKGMKVQNSLTREQLQEVTKIARGFQFVLMLPKESDAHYAGTGAKQGEPLRPIFWFKPIGSNTYRVVDSDFTIRDSSEAPQVVSAKKL